MYRPLRVLGIAPAPVLLLTACTSQAASSDGTAPSPSATRPSGQATQKKQLTSQVETALGLTTGAHSGSFVESGVERVSEGIHTRPELTDGAYQLSLVCAGGGAATTVITAPGTHTTKRLPCDQSLDSEHLTGGRSFRIDVVGAPGAPGVVAWRIDRT
ncbi:hypothetical protein [Streptomyces sp. NPDC087294]|uniref:hypothetical protein n=1 Tax=Streptomyces sp. NPDC087294 TaxID=3365777 RepID=UPI00381E3EDE